MPRSGLFCSDKVLRVPKLTSLRIVFSIFFGLISATILEICALPLETAPFRRSCFDWLTAGVENENSQTRNTNREHENRRIFRRRRVGNIWRHPLSRDVSERVKTVPTQK